MTTLLSASGLKKTFGDKPLFSNLSFVCEEGERVAILGPNGAGKSTFLSMLSGKSEPDEGSISRKRGLTAYYVPQEENFPARTIGEVLRESASEDRILHEYKGIFSLDFDSEVKSLSGGWRKRVALASAFVANPDLLLLDEPTNHLDIDGILLLEDLLIDRSVVFISHDRYFIEHVATRIIEIDPRYPQGMLHVQVPEGRGSYEAFLETREEFLENLKLREASLQNKMRREAEWLSRMPKARGTKAKYRIDAALALKKELSEINLEERRVGLEFTGSGRESKELIQLKDVSKSYGDKVLLDKFSILISRRARVGILGANGAGKTTLIRILNGSLEADSGVVRRAPDIKIATLDQTREALNPEDTLTKALCGEGNTVVFDGKSIHVASWAKRFGFRSEQLLQPVASLSGGERARVCLAQIMVQEADLLILDEPTNDLDINTLEVLEDSIKEFPGTVILVTHDRYLIDRACSVVIGFLEEGRVELFADHYQWLATRSSKKVVEAPIKKVVEKAEKTPSKKLTYKDERDWSTILERIETQENEVRALEAEVSSALGDELKIKCELLAEAQKGLESLIQRWEELERLKNG